MLDAFTDAALNFVDTADVYSGWVKGNSGGESETIIGNWLKRSGKRQQVIIATKVGKPMGGDKKGLSEKYILRAVEDSLKRLQTDYIDLYQSHEDDPYTPLEETLTAFGRLISQGKVREIGASNYSAARLAEALEVSEKNQLAAYQSIQPEYNLFDREAYEKDLEPLSLDKGLAVITYSSLASGFLTGKYRSEADLDKSQRGGGIKKYLNEKGFRILKALDEVSAQYEATPAQISLAWLMARPGITAPIASATNTKQLQDLVKATELKLDEDAMRVLDEAGKM